MEKLYLRAKNEAELIKALPFARSVDGDGNSFWRSAKHDYSLNIIGTIFKDDGVYGEIQADGEREVIKAPSQIDGFHANLKCTKEIKKKIPKDVIITQPNNPKGVWA